MEKLYNVFYISDGDHNYEITTNNFKKWLKEHNEERKKEGEIIEPPEDFSVEEIVIKRYD